MGDTLYISSNLLSRECSQFPECKPSWKIELEKQLLEVLHLSSRFNKLLEVLHLSSRFNKLSEVLYLSRFNKNLSSVNFTLSGKQAISP